MNIQSLVSEIPPQGEQNLEGIQFITSGDQYLTFVLANEQYAVDILCVEEIRSWESPTLIPNAPDCVKGVINMRGVIVPIIDLRIKFAIGKVVYHKTTVVIVLTYQGKNSSRIIGFVVDTVSDVLNVKESEIQPSLALGGSVPPQYVQGLINVGNNVVTILDVEELQKVQAHKK